MDWEANFYSEIMDHAFDVLNDGNDRFIWKCHKIIELMNILKESANEYFKIVIKNALILLLSIFEDFYVASVDLKSVDLDEISKQEKEILINTLKLEIIT